MAGDFREPDWKRLRRLQPLALERFCQRVLDEISRLAADAGQGSHERYRAVYRLLQDRDERLADAFDNPRRSAALVQLARIRAEGLLSEEEFAGFSPETRAAVRAFLEL